jgi:hypothetical protein
MAPCESHGTIQTIQLTTALLQVFMEKRDNHRESIPMGSLSAVFLSQEMVILRCAQLLVSKNVPRRRIHTCSDKMAATEKLAKTTIESAFIYERMQAVEKISRCNKVTSVWIPEHHGIPGNEEADKLAKE